MIPMTGSTPTRIVVIRSSAGDRVGTITWDEWAGVVWRRAERDLRPIHEWVNQASRAIRSAIDEFQDVQAHARPAAVPPQPPPVPLALATLPIHTPTRVFARANTNTTARPRLHARDPVPARTRRRERVWERPGRPGRG